MCVNVSASAWAISSNKMRDKRKVVDTMPTKSTSTNYSSIIQLIGNKDDEYKQK